MKERDLIKGQTERSARTNMGLTEKSLPSYAGDRFIFMSAWENVDKGTPVVAGVPTAEGQGIEPHPQAEKADDRRAFVGLDLIEALLPRRFDLGTLGPEVIAAITQKFGQRLDGEVDRAIVEMRASSDKEERLRKAWGMWLGTQPEERREMLEEQGTLQKFIALDISPDHFEKNTVLYEGLTTIQNEAFNELLLEWKDILGDEYEDQRDFVSVLIAQGISPDVFNSKYKWDRYFKSPFKEMGDLLIKEMVKVFAGDESEERSEEREKAFAGVMWDAYDKKRVADGDITPLQYTWDEASARTTAISLGMAPGVLRRGYKGEGGRRESVNPVEVIVNSKASPSERIAKLKNFLISEFGVIDLNLEADDPRAIEFVDKIHKGGTVYGLTPEEIASKREKLVKWLPRVIGEDVLGEGKDRKLKLREASRRIIEAGLAGSPPVGDPAARASLDSSEREGGEGVMRAQVEALRTKLANASPEEIQAIREGIESQQAAGAISEGNASILLNAVGDRMNAQGDEQISASERRLGNIRARLSSSSLEDLVEAERDIDSLARAGKLSPEEASARRAEIAPYKIEAADRQYDEKIIKAQEQEEQAIREIIAQYGGDPDNPDPELLVMAESMVGRSTTTHRAQIMRLGKDITERNLTPDRLRNKFIWLQRYVKDLHKNIEYGNLRLSPNSVSRISQIAKLSEEAILSEEASDSLSIQDVIRLTHELVDSDKLNIKKFFRDDLTRNEASAARRGGKLLVNSLEELAEIIANGQGEKYGIGGEMEMINERGEVVKENLIAWIREELNKQRRNSPDTEINIWSNIYIPTAFRQITFGELVYSPQYFQKRQLIITGDETGGAVRAENVSDNEYMELHDDLLMEAWLFGGSHSKDAKMRQIRGIESVLFKELPNFYSDEMFTKNRSRLLKILKLRRSGKTEKGKQREKGEQGGVGEAIMRGILAFYNMSEAVNGRTEVDAAERSLRKAEADYSADRQDDKKKKAVEKARKNLESARKLSEDNEFFRALGEGGRMKFYQSIIAQILDDKRGYADVVAEVTGKMEEDWRREQAGVPGKTRKYFSDKTRPIAMQLLEDDKGRKLLWEAIQARMKDGKTDPQAFVYQDEKGNKLEDMDLESYVSGEYEAERLARTLMQNVLKLGNDHLNIFKYKNERTDNSEIIRKAVNDAVSIPMGLNEIDREYAGNWSYSFAYWTGLAARNETQAQGFDAWSKLINFFNYRIRAFQERGGGGLKANLPGFRRLSLTPWDGMSIQFDRDADLNQGDGKLEKEEVTYRDGKRKSALHDPYLNMSFANEAERNNFIQEAKDGEKVKLIDALRMGVRGKKGLQDFDFIGVSSTHYASMHLSNASSLFSFLMDQQEVGFDGIATTDAFGRVTIDYEKAQKIMGGIRKYCHYTYDQPGLKWDTVIRMWDRGPNGKGPLVQREMTLREYFFGDEVIQLGEDLHMRDHHKKRTTKDPSNRSFNPLTGEVYDEKNVTNTDYARAAFGYIVAKEVHEHLKDFGDRKKWSTDQVRHLEAFFRHWSSDIEIDVPDEKGKMHRVRVTEPYFTKKEWDAILDFVESPYWKLYAKDFLFQLGFGFFEGLREMMGDILKEISPDKILK